MFGDALAEYFETVHYFGSGVYIDSVAVTFSGKYFI